MLTLARLPSRARLIKPELPSRIDYSTDFIGGRTMHTKLRSNRLVGKTITSRAEPRSDQLGTRPTTMSH